MFGLLLIAASFAVAYYAGGWWWVIAAVNSWALGVMFNFKREERAPRWTGLAMPLSLAVVVRGAMLLFASYAKP